MRSSTGRRRRAGPPSFLIPMRGNENPEYASNLAGDPKFLIPMRGNESEITTTTLRNRTSS